MAEFINLQVFGVPILTYGLVGVTTAVLAYATSIGMEDTISKTMGALTEMTANPLGSLSNVSPFSDKDKEQGQDKEQDKEQGQDKDKEQESGQGQDKEKEVEEPKPATENPTELTGGKKKRKRKTPKAKRRKNKSNRASK